MSQKDTPKLTINSVPKKEPRVQMNVSKSIAEEIYAIAEETNNGRREVTDTLLRFALEHCELSV
ncbi:MAG: hypothetical protein LKF42_09790 [Streptococcaceae bacterium]|jgi:hypothetical protein|nr:hypothetical protein [Streptococcaceae bacterium]